MKKGIIFLLLFFSMGLVSWNYKKSNKANPLNYISSSSSLLVGFDFNSLKSKVDAQKLMAMMDPGLDSSARSSREINPFNQIFDNPELIGLDFTQKVYMLIQPNGEKSKPTVNFYFSINDAGKFKRWIQREVGALNIVSGKLFSYVLVSHSKSSDAYIWNDDMLIIHGTELKPNVKNFDKLIAPVSTPISALPFSQQVFYAKNDVLFFMNSRELEKFSNSNQKSKKVNEMLRKLPLLRGQYYACGMNFENGKIVFDAKILFSDKTTEENYRSMIRKDGGVNLFQSLTAGEPWAVLNLNYEIEKVAKFYNLNDLPAKDAKSLEKATGLTEDEFFAMFDGRFSLAFDGLISQTVTTYEYDEDGNKREVEKEKQSPDLSLFIGIKNWDHLNKALKTSGISIPDGDYLQLPGKFSSYLTKNSQGLFIFTDRGKADAFIERGIVGNTLIKNQELLKEYPVYFSFDWAIARASIRDMLNKTPFNLGEDMQGKGVRSITSYSDGINSHAEIVFGDSETNALELISEWVIKLGQKFNGRKNLGLDR